MKRSLTALIIGTAIFSVLIGGFGPLKPETDSYIHSPVYSSGPVAEEQSAELTPAPEESSETPASGKISEDPAPDSSALKTIKGNLFDDWSAIGANYSGAYLPLSYLDLNISVRLNADGTAVMGNESEIYTGTWTEKDGRLILKEDGYDDIFECKYDQKADHLLITYKTEDGETEFVMARKGSDEVKEAQEALAEARKAAAAENSGEAGSGPVTLPTPDDGIVYETESAVLFDKEKIKAVLDPKIVLSESEGAYFTIQVDNENDYSIALAMLDDHFYINDCKLPCIPEELSNEIAANTSGATVLFHVPSEYIRLYGIEGIAKLEFIMYAQNTDDFSGTPTDSDLVTVTTGEEAVQSDFSEQLEPSYDISGITIAYGGDNTIDEDDEEFLYPLFIYLENNTDHPVSVIPDSSFVNETEFPLIMFEHLLPGKKTMARVFLEKSEAEAEEISSVETLVVSFDILNENDYTDFSTDLLTLKEDPDEAE